MKRKTSLFIFLLIEELKLKSDIELEKLLDFVADLNNGIPFSPIYKVGEEYFFSYRTCYIGDLNRMVYNHFITEKLYNSSGKKKGSEEAKQIGQNNESRESSFNHSIKNVISAITHYVEYGVKYNSGKLSGDIDVIAYFKDENIIMPIQVKLSNTSLHTEKGKSVWIDNQIIKRGLDQVDKDLKLLSLNSGIEFIAKKLKIDDVPRLKNATIYPLIITDNFYVDHERFIYSDNGKKVMCVSFFELKHLIMNINIHEKQVKWNSFQENCCNQPAKD